MKFSNSNKGNVNISVDLKESVPSFAVDIMCIVLHLALYLLQDAIYEWLKVFFLLEAFSLSKSLYSIYLWCLGHKLIFKN